MRNVTPFLAVAALAGLFTAGCAGPEQKMGRGVSNTLNIVNMGEINRGVEQSAVMGTPAPGYATGFFHGLNQTLARTGMGVYEIVTFPFPPYHPVATKYVSPTQGYPDSYKPGLFDGSTFQTDTYYGFSGGDIAPFVPGSRFAVFQN
ncbi:MAG: exosortase system-associated protein, TIGR04073 family [Verrucomicrobiales bacterium]|nr:exosortase system-associated protein, TIGR04073 family [Verrucomicrobiales bacterium]